jgi:Fe/S biogenesis protein NfuA
MFEITEAAREKLVELMKNNNRQGDALRVAIRGRGPYGFMYEMGFVSSEGAAEGDAVIESGGFQVLIDAESIPNIGGSTLDYVEDAYQSGFKIDNPNPLWRDPLAQKVQEVLDKRVNPSIAEHGGFISLVDVKDDVAYVAMGGGCQGCGMARVTLSDGVEVMIREAVPEIREIVDLTDHSEGRNPYHGSDEKD